MGEQKETVRTMGIQTPKDPVGLITERKSVDRSSRRPARPTACQLFRTGERCQQCPVAGKSK